MATWRSSPPFGGLTDRIASVFLLLLLFGEQLDYCLSV
jgi:hypothetical protein